MQMPTYMRKILLNDRYLEKSHFS